MDDQVQTDDIDHLFARLASPPLPIGLIEQAMVQANPRRTRRRRRRFAIALGGYMALLATITLLAFAFGRNLISGGADRILTLAILEPAAVGSAPQDFLWAFLESIPWQWLAALLLAFVILAWSIRTFAVLLASAQTRDQKREALHA